MSDMISVPVDVWRKVLNDLEFLKRALVPLAKSYKPSRWMTAIDIMNPDDPQHLKIGRERLKQLRYSGKIVCRKAGRHIEYLREDIEAYKNGDIIISSAKRITSN